MNYLKYTYMKKYYYTLAASGFLLLTSCTSVLDKEDFSAITPGDVWKNEKMIDAVINDIHGSLMPGWNYSTEVSDEAPHSRAGFNTFLQGTATIDSWDNWPYKSIEKINLFLKNIKSTSFEQSIPKWEGQALFWRAWCYFSMVKGYGGVPLILEPQDPMDKEALFIERSSTTACFDQIIKDLEDAIGFLPDKWDSNAYGRIDKGAAMAFKGRVMLFRASPLFNPGNADPQKWKDAYNANLQAVEYLRAQGKELYPEYGNIWYNERNEEVVMVNQFFAPDHKYGQNSIRAMSYTKDDVAHNLPMMNTVNTFPMVDGSDFDPTVCAYDTLFKHRDKRFYATVAYNGCDYNIKELKPGEHLWTGRDSKGMSIEFPIHNPGENFDPINTGFLCKKGLDPTIDKSTVGDATVDWVEIRFAEVLMNYGECANEVDKPDEALSVLYEIRKRAGILPGKNETYGIKETGKDAIRERYIKERFVEFLFEGKRLDDLRRWRRFDIINNQKKQYGIQSWLKPGAELPKITDDINQIWDRFEPRIVEVTPLYTYDMKEQYYFYAIPRKHLDKNYKLKQNNNWDGGEFDPLK